LKVILIDDDSLALDYVEDLLKSVEGVRVINLQPVQKEHLVDNIHRYSTANYTQYPMVCCFQNLRFVCLGDEPSEIDVHWRTAKARELFSYLLHHRNQFVRKDVLIELLWPDSDFKHGYAQLYSTIYQVRKTLESIHFDIEIKSSDIGYKMELNGVKLDVEEWENGLESLSIIDRNTLPKCRKFMQLYQGAYFSEDDYLWADHERKRLKILYYSHIKKLTDYLISTGDYVEAILIYLKLQGFDPYFEDSYFMLMKLYDAIGDRTSVIEQYNKLKAMISAEYDSAPSLFIQDWYKNWEEANLVK
jgi:two-component system, LytTR family, response regulator